LIWAWDETFDIGLDTGSPVDDRDYQVPFAFTGKLGKITARLFSRPWGIPPWPRAGRRPVAQYLDEARKQRLLSAYGLARKHHT
jgi:hypothetical protein